MHPDEAYDWGAQGLMEQSMSALTQDAFARAGTFGSEGWVEDNYDALMWGEQDLFGGATSVGERVWQADIDADVDTSGWNDPAGLGPAFGRSAWQGDVDSDVDTDISFGQGPGYPDAEERMWDATIEDDPYADYF
jgi:hypothetical protein